MSYATGLYIDSTVSNVVCMFMEFFVPDIHGRLLVDETDDRNTEGLLMLAIEERSRDGAHSLCR